MENITLNITEAPENVTLNIEECLSRVYVDGITITGTGRPTNPFTAVAGTGDMLRSTYDPTNVNASAFDMENMIEGATKKILTSAERTKLNNLSGTNTGDQDLTPYLTSATAAATYQPIGSYLTSISGLNISQLTNDSGYITSSALTGLVPYTGATAAVNLGEYSLSAGHLQFDTTPTAQASAVGKMVWNDTDGTLNLGLKGGNVILQIGQEQVARVVNKTSTNLTQTGYKCVRITGAQGQRIKVELAQANNVINSTDVLGLVTENIADNQEGFITTFGMVRDIDTTGSLQGETWADGDALYLSPATAGGLTKTKPAAYVVAIGYVVHSHSTQGSIFVSVHSFAGLVPETRNITINGTTYDLSADRSWTISAGTTYTFSTGLTNNAGTITANLATGVAGGQSVIGGTAASNNLTLSSTSNATKGKILFGNSAYDEANNRLGLGTSSPSALLHITASAEVMRVQGDSAFITFYNNGNNTRTSYIQADNTNKWFNISVENSLKFRTFLGSLEAHIIDLSGRHGIGGVTSPTAFMDIKAGTTAIAPLRLNAGTNLTTPVNGAFEYDGTNLYFTTGGVRKTVTLV